MAVYGGGSPGARVVAFPFVPDGFELRFAQSDRGTFSGGEMPVHGQKQCVRIAIGNRPEGADDIRTAGGEGSAEA